MNYREVEIPKNTKSYTAISHGNLVDLVKEKLDKTGLIVVDEKITLARNGDQLFGTLTCGHGDTEQNMTIGFRNSYDKSLAVGIVSGSRVIVCSNLMFKGDFKVMRKHTSGINPIELELLVEGGVNSMEKQFIKIVEDTKLMKEKEITKKTMSELVGRMFIQENLITATQISIIKEQILNSKSFKGETLWDFYNHNTEALKVSHPATAINDHIKIHEFMLTQI